MSSYEELLRFLNTRDSHIERRLKVSLAMTKDPKVQELIEEIEKEFVGSKMFAYGTRKMQLGHENSHINLFMDVDNSYWLPQKPEKADETFGKLMIFFNKKVAEAQKIRNDNKKTENQSLHILKSAKDLEEEKRNLYWRGPVKTLRTPVQTLRVVYRNLQVDVTVSSGLGVENNNLVHYLFKLQPEAFKLYHFARLWIHIDVYGFKRYMVALLVIFYLQNKGFLPSIVDLQAECGEKFIDGWNVEFDHQASLKALKLNAILDYTPHMHGFFQFYQDFDFANNVICPYLGRAVPIKDFPKKVPELEKYEDKIRNFNFKPINVADLLNLNFNIGYNVGKKRVKKFLDFCPKAQDLLREDSQGGTTTDQLLQKLQNMRF